MDCAKEPTYLSKVILLHGGENAGSLRVVQRPWRPVDIIVLKVMSLLSLSHKVTLYTNR
jgi:hypothetical protein